MTIFISQLKIGRNKKRIFEGNVSFSLLLINGLVFSSNCNCIKVETFFIEKKDLFRVFMESLKRIQPMVSYIDMNTFFTNPSRPQCHFNFEAQIQLNVILRRSLQPEDCKNKFVSWKVWVEQLDFQLSSLLCHLPWSSNFISSPLSFQNVFSPTTLFLNAAAWQRRNSQQKWKLWIEKESIGVEKPQIKENQEKSTEWWFWGSWRKILRPKMSGIAG